MLSANRATYRNTSPVPAREKHIPTNNLQCLQRQYGPARSVRFSVTFCLLCGLTSFATVGCHNDDAKNESAEKASSQKDQNIETEAERCRKKLAAAIRRLAPEALALQDNPERSINGLNSWISTCAVDELESLQLGEPTLVMIGKSARATAGRYTANDGAYIRDCLLLRSLSDAISIRSGVDATDRSRHTDASRIMATFEWVVRNVSLVPEGKDRIPLGLFDILLTGRGTAEDRAWVFAESLRQQQIDAVIVRTEEPPIEGETLDTASWLVAVFVDTQSFLFDLRVGIAVPASDSSNSTDAPIASISNLAEHDRWIDATIGVVAQISAFAPRMLVLQEQLAAEDSAILFEELTGGVSEIVPLVDRIKAASKQLWTANRVSLWKYPEQQVVASSAMDEKQEQAYNLLMRPFQAPFERKDFAPESTEELTTVPEELSPDERQALVQQRLLEGFGRMMESSDDMFGKPSNALLKARIRQIQGEIDTGVIQQLQQIRIASMQEAMRIRVPEALQQEYGYPPTMVIPFPEIIREVNQSSTGDSLYWTALCQIDRNEVGAAIITLMNYRRQYPDGKWKFSTMINQGLALLQQDRTVDAAAVLKEADVEANPERDRVQHLLKSLEE